MSSSNTKHSTLEKDLLPARRVATSTRCSVAWTAFHGVHLVRLASFSSTHMVSYTGSR